MDDKWQVLREDIIAILKAGKGGVSLRKIEQSLSSVSSLQIRQQLSKLQADGLAYRSMALWHLASRAIDDGVDAQSLFRGSRRIRAQSVVSNESRWGEFRRLCLYYAECVRLGDRAKVSAYADKENSDFLSVKVPVDWRSLSEGAHLALTIPDEWGAFLRHIKGRNTEPRIFLGAPVDLWVGKTRDGDTCRVISPVFVLQLKAQIKKGMLHLEPVDSIEINHEWVEKRFKNQDDQRTFAELCGFDAFESGDDEPPSLLPTMQQAAEAMFSCYKDWWKEYANLSQLNISPPLQEMDTKGIYNRALLIAQPRLKYSGRLYEELLWLGNHAADEDLDGTALRHLFSHEMPSRSTQINTVDAQAGDTETEMPDIGQYDKLNAEQRHACRAAMRKPLVVVTGPPGTGKSRVVAQTMANMALRRKSVLFASRNHRALEAVVPQMNELVEPELLAVRLSQPFGDDNAVSLTQAIVNVLALPTASDITPRLEDSIRRLDGALKVRERYELQRHRAFELYSEVDMAQIAQEEALAGLSDKSVDIIGTCPELYDSEYLTGVVDRLGKTLAVPVGWFSRFLWRIKNCILVPKLKREIRNIDKKFCKCFGAVEIGEGQLNDASYIQMLVRNLEDWAIIAKAIKATKMLIQARKSLEMVPSLDECHKQCDRQAEHVMQYTRDALRLLAESYGANLLPETRQKFAEIRGELRSAGNNYDRHSRKLLQALRHSFTTILNEIPLWATVNLSAGRTVPRVAGAFDLLIVDEASQCDIASVIPLLYRARRAMVVGDPMQLSHISTMKPATARRLRLQYSLTDTKFGRYDSRVNSFYDLASTDASLDYTIRLQDHHRCHHRIADYCNKTFYRDTLRVMTDSDRLMCPASKGKKYAGFRWTAVPADVESNSGGGAISRAQIDAIIQELQRLAADMFPGTVGVVTPFRAQANRIRDRVQKDMGPNVPERWRLHIDTADGFQGDERDVILLSLPVGEQMPRGAYWFLNHNKNRFNVAVSRARALLHIFADSQWCQKCDIPHIKALHTAWAQQSSSEQQNQSHYLIGPKWEPALAAALRQAGIPFVQQYQACGRYLDFAVFAGSLKLDIEVDGEAFHKNYDGSRKLDDLRRDMSLIANGWRVLRFWVYELKEDMSRCVEVIQSAYGQGVSQEKTDALSGSEQ